MKIHIQKPAREDLSINFVLSPFITDWASAQTRFIAAIARELSDVLSVRAMDFSANPSSELGESWCKYRIFGGASTIVLNPGALQLNFVNLSENDYPTVKEIIRRSKGVLSKDIGGYTRERVSLSSNLHVGTVEKGVADVYLEQFAVKQVTEVAKTDSRILYSPAVKVILSDNSKNAVNWVVHRSVEKSEWLPDGLFVTTFIDVSSPGVMSFEDQAQLVQRIYGLADQAVGQQPSGGNANDAVS